MGANPRPPREVKIDQQRHKASMVRSLSYIPFDRSGHRAPHISLRFFACLRGRTPTASSRLGCSGVFGVSASGGGLLANPHCGHPAPPPATPTTTPWLINIPPDKRSVGGTSMIDTRREVREVKSRTSSWLAWALLAAAAAAVVTINNRPSPSPEEVLRRAFDEEKAKQERAAEEAKRQQEGPPKHNGRRMPWPSALITYARPTHGIRALTHIMTRAAAPLVPGFSGKSACPRWGAQWIEPTA